MSFNAMLFAPAWGRGFQTGFSPEGKQYSLSEEDQRLKTGFIVKLSNSRQIKIKSNKYTFLNYKTTHGRHFEDPGNLN